MTLFIKSTLFVIPFISAVLQATEIDHIYAGKFVWGHEVRSISLCNQQIWHWAYLHEPNNKMIEYYIKNQNKPYQEIYIKFKGHFSSMNSTGFSELYNSKIQLTEIIEYSFEIPKSCH
jgi:hypothetical protein